MQGLDYCRQKAEESRSSFLSGFRFLPQEKRDAITVLYAFCRELDDVVDDYALIGLAYFFRYECGAGNVELVARRFGQGIRRHDAGASGQSGFATG